MACAVEPAPAALLGERSQADHAREFLALCGLLDGAPAEEEAAFAGPAFGPARERLCVQKCPCQAFACEHAAPMQEPRTAERAKRQPPDGREEPAGRAAQAEPREAAVVKREPREAPARGPRKRAASRGPSPAPASAAKRRRSRSAAKAAPAAPAPGVEGGAKPFACPEPGCRKRFTEEWMLTRHASAHAVKAFACDQCAWKFASAEKLAAHVANKHGQATFQCADCAWKFPTAEKLAAHRKNRHEDGAAYGRKLRAQKEQLAKHLAAEEQGHKCQHCGQCFKYKDRLLAHEKTHAAWTERQAFACAHPGCKKTYMSKFALDQHVQSAHEKRRFQCACGSSFTSKQRLIAHRLREHDGQKPPAEPKTRKAAPLVGENRPFADLLMVGGA